MMLHLWEVFWHNERRQQLRAVNLSMTMLLNEHPEAQKMLSKPPVWIHVHAVLLQRSNYIPE
jgi:hypothetical protein